MTILFLVLPGIVDIPTVSEIQPRDVVVTWAMPSSDGGTPITHYIIEQRLVSLFGTSSPDNTGWMVSIGNVGGNNSLMGRVSSLNPYSGYQFRVKAVNMAGSGSPGVPSTVIITPEAGKCVKFCTPVLLTSLSHLLNL